MKVVVVQPLGDQLIGLLQKSALDWSAYDEVAKSKQELIERIGDADIVSGWSIKIDQEVFDACPNLKYIAVPAVGAGDAVDMEEARKRGVTVMNCPGYNAESVAEFAVMLALLARKRVLPVIHSLREGNWQVHAHRRNVQANISNSRVTIIGYGNIGQRIHELIKPWNAKVKTINSKSSSDEIDEACASADIVFVCCSLNSKTKGMISKRRLELIGSKGTIVNVSRGAIIDEEALYEILRTGKLASAGLDVFVHEPIDDGPVGVAIKRFSELSNVVCTPHISGMSITSAENLGNSLFENIMSCVDGSPKNIYTE